MEYDINELREKIDNYFIGMISKKELGEWANRAYYDLLKGGYVENKKIVLYPFLKDISTFHLEGNDKDDVYPCSEESIKEIQDIVHGKINFCFDIEMSIPVQVYTMFKDKPYFDKDRRNIFLKIRENVFCCLEQKNMLDDLKKYLEKVEHIEFQTDTIQGLIEKYILQLLKIFVISKSIDTGRKKKFKLFASKLEKGNLIEKRLLDYLDSYVGNRNFHLIISYKNGEPDILMLV